MQKILRTSVNIALLCTIVVGLFLPKSGLSRPSDIDEDHRNFNQLRLHWVYNSYGKCGINHNTHNYLKRVCNNEIPGADPVGCHILRNNNLGPQQDYNWLVCAADCLESRFSLHASLIKCQDAALSSCQSYKQSCEAQKTRALSEINGYKSVINGYNLMASSAIQGAAISVIPELISDVLESRGYSHWTSNFASTIAQAGVMAYTAASIVPTITGTAVRKSCDWLGAPSRVSIIAGTTAAVVASIAVSDMSFSEDRMTNSAIGLAGSYIGGMFALQAKSWIYSVWNRLTT